MFSTLRHKHQTSCCVFCDRYTKDVLALRGERLQKSAISLFDVQSHVRPAHFGRTVREHTQEMIRKADDNRARMESKLDQVFKALSNSNKGSGSDGGGAAAAAAASASANMAVRRTTSEGEPPPTFTDGRAGRGQISPVAASRKSNSGTGGGEDANGGGVGSAIVAAGRGDARRQPQDGKYGGGSGRLQAQRSEPDLDEFIDQFHAELR